MAVKRQEKEMTQKPPPLHTAEKEALADPAHYKTIELRGVGERIVKAWPLGQYARAKHHADNTYRTGLYIVGTNGMSVPYQPGIFEAPQ